MPYAPTERQDLSGLTGGIAQAGASLAQGLQKFSQNKQRMDALELSATMLAREHPDLIDPDTLEKFSKGGLGQREALVGQMTARVAEKFKTEALDLQKLNTQVDVARLNEHARQFNTREENDLRGAIPQFLSEPKNGVIGFVPKTGQLLKDATKPTLTEPDTAWTVHNGPDGKPAAKTRWNPYTGKTETIALRSGTGDPFAALGLPSGSAGTGTGGLIPQQPGPSASTKNPVVGQIYKDASGRRARYNQDGTWTEIP